MKTASAVAGGVVLSCAAAFALQRVWVQGYQSSVSLRVANVPGVMDSVIESRAMASPAILDEVAAAMPTYESRAVNAGIFVPSVLQSDSLVTSITIQQGLKVSNTTSPSVVDVSLTLPTAEAAEKGLATLVGSYQSHRAALLPARDGKALATAIANRHKASQQLQQFDQASAKENSRNGPGEVLSQRKLLEERSDALRRDADRLFAEASGYSQACDEIEKRIDDFSDTIVTSRWHGPDPVTQSLKEKMVQAQLELVKANSQYLANTPPVRNAKETVDVLQKQLDSLTGDDRDLCTLDEVNPAKRDLSLRLEKTRIDLAAALATARHATEQAKQVDSAIAKLDQAQARKQVTSLERMPIEREIAFWDSAIDSARARMLQQDEARDSFAAITPVAQAQPVRASMGMCMLLTSPIGFLAGALPLIARRRRRETILPQIKCSPASATV